MAQVVILATETISLHFKQTVDEAGNAIDWWRVFSVGNETTFLGADVIINLTSRLTNYLKSVDIEEKPLYEHDGNKIIWITSLAEKHACLYGTIPSEDDGAIIYCVEDGGHFLPELKLNKQIVNEWISKLETIE